MAPFTGILLSNDRAQHLIELSLDGIAARNGAFVAPAWQRWGTFVGVVIGTSLTTYLATKKR